MGAECGPHKRGHAYTVIDRKGPALFPTTSDKHWGWKEDLKLIKAAHKHKLGNWYVLMLSAQKILYASF